MIWSKIALACLVALSPLACSESGAPREPEPQPQEELGPIEVMSPMLTLGGVVGKQDGFAPMATIDASPFPSWIVMMTAGADPVTLTRSGVATELLPASNAQRFVFVRVRSDGTISRAIDAPIAGDVLPLGVFIQPCGGSVWATGYGEDGLTHWLMRMDPMLSAIEVATFVVSPGVEGFTEIWINDLSCTGNRLYFTMRHAGVLVVTPPDGAPTTLTSDIYDMRVVAAEQLFDEGRIDANAVGRDHEIQSMLPGADGGLLMSIFRDEGAGTAVARFDASADAFAELASLDLAVFVRAMAESSGGEQLLCILRPVAGTLAFGGATFPDVNANSICVLRDKAGAVPIELRALVEQAFFEDDGPLWLNGFLYGTDPIVGDGSVVAPDAHPPYLAALDPGTREVVARAYWSEDGRISEVDGAFAARGLEGCTAPSSGAMRVVTTDSLNSDTPQMAVDFRLVLAGRNAAACSSHIARWVSFDSPAYISLSATPATDCDHARYLAALPGTTRLEIDTASGLRSASGTGNGLDLIVFSPSQCSIERR